MGVDATADSLGNSPEQGRREENQLTRRLRTSTKNGKITDSGLEVDWVGKNLNHQTIPITSEE